MKAVGGQLLRKAIRTMPKKKLSNAERERFRKRLKKLRGSWKSGGAVLKYLLEERRREFEREEEKVR